MRTPHRSTDRPTERREVSGPCPQLERCCGPSGRGSGHRAEARRAYHPDGSSLPHGACTGGSSVPAGGRRGLWPPRQGKWGALRLTTEGRRSGAPRSVILGYVEEGPNLVSIAMNGWGAAEPAWWLNLQAHPEAVVELAGGIRREVLSRVAVGEERERLWRRMRELDPNLDGYAARRPHETAVVVFEPRAVAE
jgi:deazaflavin-dependent oxidoreductase (nitroreductase family)